MFRQPPPAALAAVLCLAACSTDPTIPEGPASLEVVGAATGTPGWLLDEPLAVRVTDAAGEPVEGAAITWSTGEAGAWLGAESSVTDQEGVARVNFAPGWRRGIQVVNAVGGGLSAAVPVSATSLTVVSADAALSFGIRYCGLDGTGNLWCWYQGPIDGVRSPPPPRTDDAFPVHVDPDHRYIQVVGDGLSGSAPMCGLTDAYELRCWSPTGLQPSVVTTPVAFHHIARTIGDRSLATCGLDADGQAWCRGENNFGQLGDGTATSRQEFAPVLGATRFVALYGGYGSFCGLDAEQRAWCWGFGRPIGDGTAGTIDQPTRVGGDRAYSVLGFVFGGTCGLASATRDLHCWGFTGMTGAEDPDGESIRVPTASGFAQFSGRDEFGIFRTAGGELLFAGDMAHDLGVNAFVRIPMALEGMPTDVSAIVSQGGNAWCVAHASGSTICGSRVRRPVGVPAPR